MYFCFDFHLGIWMEVVRLRRVKYCKGGKCYTQYYVTIPSKIAKALGEPEKFRIEIRDNCIVLVPLR